MNAKTKLTIVAIVLLAVTVGLGQNPVRPSDSRTAPTSAAKPAPAADKYIIGPDDVLAINVWKEPDVSRAVPVRSDGKISLPLAGEIQASGQTPKQLETE